MNIFTIAVTICLISLLPISVRAESLSCNIDRIVFPDTNAESLSKEEYVLCDSEILKEIDRQEKEIQEKEEYQKKVDDAKRQAISDSLKGELSGHEDLFYDRAIELGLDPVFAVALSSWETGYGSSTICINKHNFGGMRGRDGWMSFNTTEEGIEAFLNLLSSYKAKGLTTAADMASRYAEGSESWVKGVNSIVTKINNRVNEYHEAIEV